MTQRWPLVPDWAAASPPPATNAVVGAGSLLNSIRPVSRKHRVCRLRRFEASKKICVARQPAHRGFRYAMLAISWGVAGPRPSEALSGRALAPNTAGESPARPVRQHLLLLARCHGRWDRDSTPELLGPGPPKFHSTRELSKNDLSTLYDDAWSPSFCTSSALRSLRKPAYMRIIVGTAAP